METLLEKAKRLGMQPAVTPVVTKTAAPVVDPAAPTESLLQKAQRLGVKPAAIAPVKKPIDFKGAAIDVVTGNPLGALDKVTGNHVKDAVLDGIPKIPTVFKSNESDGTVKTAAKTIGNVPVSGINFATGIINFLNPVKNVKDIVKNTGEIIREVHDYSKTSGEHPLIVLGKSLIDTTPTGRIDPATGKPGKTWNFGSNAADMLLPNFIKEIGRGDFEAAKKSIVEHPIEEIGPLVLMAKGVAEKTGNGAAFDRAMETVAKPVTVPSKFAAETTIKGLKSVKGAMEKSVVEGARSEWAKPTSKTAAAYNKATDIYNEANSKGHDIADTLVKNKIRLQDNVQEGKYNTADTATKIRSDAAKSSGDLLRPALEEANPSVQKVPVNKVVESTIADIRRSKGITAGDIEAQIKKATKEGEALARKYPDGMELTDLHDNRINYSQNGGYKFGDDPNTGNIKAVNRAYSRVLNDSLDNTAPENIPVKAFRKELAKQYQAAEYLDALDSKKVPTSIMSRIAKTTAKVVGASTGVQLGGGIMGGVGGYHIGGMIESLIENMPNPVKSVFLNNLQKTNPEAFKVVSEALGTMREAKSTRLALPAPKSIITPEPPFKSKTAPIEQLRAENNARIKQQGIDNTLRLPAPKNVINLESSEVIKGKKSISEPGSYNKIADTIDSFVSNPSKIKLYRGGGDGFNFTNDKSFAEVWGKLRKPVILDETSNIKVIKTPEALDFGNDYGSKGNIVPGKSYQKYFDEGYDAVVHPDPYMTDKMQVVVNPDIINKMKAPSSMPLKELPPLKLINEGKNKLYNKTIKSLPKAK